MKSAFLAAALCALVLPRLWAENKFVADNGEDGYIIASDGYSFQGNYRASIDLLEKSLPGVTVAEEQAEIYWRLSRDTLRLADDLGWQGAASGEASPHARRAATAKLLSMYKEGEAYADHAISLEPSRAEGYLWKAANIDRWAQTRGILASLYETGPMRRLLVTAAHLDPSLADVWFVLAQLYSQVPGYPLSFGNDAWAVSLGRKAIDARAAELQKGLVRSIPAEYYIRLAEELAKRDWTESTRITEHEAEAQQFFLLSGLVRKSVYYEGTIPIPNLSDRQEAIDLVRKVVNTLLDTPNRTIAENRALSQAQADLYEWTTPPSP